jgi:restriction system protein
MACWTVRSPQSPSPGQLKGEAVRAWTVRGGEYGEFESAALEKGLVALGWMKVPDISSVSSIEELTEVVRKAYGGSSPRSIYNWTHQLWRFANVMEIDDLVVMPRKFKPVIAIGRLTGVYEYRPDAAVGYRHIRQVAWLNPAVERAAVRGDLRDSMGSLLTVSELRGRDAVERVDSLARTGKDPGYSGDVPPPADPEQLRREVDEVGTRQLSVRDLIGLWGWQRRTSDAIESVDQGLDQLGLTVEPYFTGVQLGDLVTVSAVEVEEAQDDQADSSGTAHLRGAAAVEDTAARRDPTWRIGNLSLPKTVVAVEAQEPLGRAIGLMVENEFSQLPVVDQHGRLLGIVTWESIAHANFRQQHPKTVADATLANPRTCRESDEVFPHIDDIYKYGFLIVVDGENIVTSILTAADLAAELRNRVQPFTLLEEIERRLRRVVSVLPVEDLRASFRRGDPRVKTAMSAGDLTLGNYSFLIDDDARWAKLAWPYERAEMVEHLRKVADYRNDLTHWDIDAPGEYSEELAHAKRVLKLLKILDSDRP